ncbi:MAG: PilZ domain-containing protein [Phycisphaerales bacterium]
MVIRGDSASAGDKRRRGRVRADALLTDFGPAVEFSETGIRLRVSRFSRLHRGMETPLLLSCPEGALECRARVCWLRPDGLLHRLAGLQFLDDSPLFKLRLRALAASCMDVRTISAPLGDEPLRRSA